MSRSLKQWQPPSQRRLRMWDLQNKWLTLKDKGDNILCCGTGLGYLFLWKQNSTLATPEFEETLARRVGTGQEIMAISWCKRNNQLVTTTYDKRIQLWTVGTPYTLSNIFSVELPTTVPRAVYFHGANVLVFGMYDGEIHTLRGKDGVILATKTIGRMIIFRGNVAIDAACSSFVIDNAVNGFSLHRMEDAVCTRTYDINPKKGFPKQVVIAEGGLMVVGRGNDRSIYVFDKGTSEVVQTL
ncbi:WD40-repeat-containing domain protein [Pisolithus marmoratus]|nr:WD40-repeat-containing domain protein [Pisolithus marmoratus]